MAPRATEPKPRTSTSPNIAVRRSVRVASSTPKPSTQNTTTEAPVLKKRKHQVSTSKPEPRAPSAFAVPDIPATPPPKRRKPASDSPLKSIPPTTPTPSTVSLLAHTSSPAQALPSGTPRQAGPHATNAPLSTPNGSRVVAYSSSTSTTATAAPPQEDTSQLLPSSSNPTFTSPNKKRKAKEALPPDVGERSAPTATVDTLLADACGHLLLVDPKLQGLVEKHRCKEFSPEGLREVVDPFTALASGIIGQQVSGQAAKSIKQKFINLFPSAPAFPTPSTVLTLDIPTLRTAGLSQRKAEYITGLAEKFASGELSAQMLISASDEELIEKLVAVRGLGRWSVEMFACFGLKRMDVFSTGDLGVQRGMATYMGRDTSKLKAKGGKWKYMSEQEMLNIASRFSPYRSLFMWYMWRIENVDISVMQSS